MGTAEITIAFDTDRLTGYPDSYLAMLWHLVQANPADGFANSEPGDLAERVGWEIIRRWLRDVPPELYHHQGRHYYWHQLGKLARYEPPAGAPAGSRQWHAGTWVPRAGQGPQP